VRRQPFFRPDGPRIVGSKVSPECPESSLFR